MMVTVRLIIIIRYYDGRFFFAKSTPWTRLLFREVFEVLSNTTTNYELDDAFNLVVDINSYGLVCVVAVRTVLLVVA